jgi:hypothetical protein
MINQMDWCSSLSLLADPGQIMTAAGMPPDPWQDAILAKRPSRLLLNCTRQSGKSTTVAAMAVDELLRGPALVLAICPSERQSKELLKTTRAIYERVARIDEQQSTTCLEFPNGARMFALPSKESNIRGFAKVALLLIDEAARVADDLYRAVRPMLAVSGGRMACLSTPFGKRGFFFKEWTDGENWERVRITAEQCPRISAEFLAAEKRSLPDAWYRQEYCCEFAEAEGAAFSYEDIQAAFDGGLQPLYPGMAADVDADVKPLFARI